MERRLSLHPRQPWRTNALYHCWWCTAPPPALATCAQVTAALKREGFADTKDSLAMLKDVCALKSRGDSDRLWRKRRGAALIRLRTEKSLFARLPSELFGNVLTFLA